MNCFSELFVFCSKHQMHCPVQCKSIWKRSPILPRMYDTYWDIQDQIIGLSSHWTQSGFRSILLGRTELVLSQGSNIMLAFLCPSLPSLSLSLLFATLLVFSFSKSNSLLFFKYHAAKTTSRFASSVLSGRWLGGGSWIVWHWLDGLGLVETDSRGGDEQEPRRGFLIT